VRKAGSSATLVPLDDARTTTALPAPLAVWKRSLPAARTFLGRHSGVA